MGNESIILWLVVKVNEVNVNQYNLEIVGLFSDENLAVKACKAENYVIGPLELDKEYQDESVEWPGAYYPLA